ncbi:MAG: PilZ domain-containing protein [Deltaproteobacteria bacterium]|nr:PilZ domain-containing protein [Deltaproteobacteria bacterium]
MAGTKDDRLYKRIEVTSFRVNATLAVVVANRTMGCLVPLKDVSKSGAGVYSKVKVDKETLVRLSLEDFPPMEGKVVWCGSSTFDPGAPPTHPFRLGIEFTPKDDVAREVQIAIYRFLAKLAGTSE